jgi:hypothetical protein
MLFKTYCAKNGLYTKESGSATHLMMDGGKLEVNPQKYPDFLEKYFKSINKGEKLSIVEKLGKNCTMRFFLDLDFKKGSANLEKILQVANDVVKCEPTIFKCTQYCGYHIIYNTEVSMEDAEKKANDIKKKLDIKVGSTIDTSVYRSGLRMIGSLKYSHKTKSMENRWYTSIDENITFDVLKSSIVRIKTTNEIDDEVYCIPCDQTHYHKAMVKIHSEYKKARILGVKQFNETMCIRTDSNFCTNIGGYHKSCHVYFVINKGNMSQKCFCSCRNSKGRRYSYCDSYISKSVRVSVHLKV